MINHERLVAYLRAEVEMHAASEWRGTEPIPVSVLDSQDALRIVRALVAHVTEGTPLPETAPHA